MNAISIKTYQCIQWRKNEFDAEKMLVWPDQNFSLRFVTIVRFICLMEHNDVVIVSMIPSNNRK